MLPGGEIPGGRSESEGRDKFIQNAANTYKQKRLEPKRTQRDPPHPAPSPFQRREHPQLSPGYHQAGAEEAGRACAAVPGHLRGRRGGGAGRGRGGGGALAPRPRPRPLQRPPPRDWLGRGRGPESPEVRLTCPGGPRSELWATRLMASARSLGRRGGHR